MVKISVKKKVKYLISFIIAILFSYIVIKDISWKIFYNTIIRSNFLFLFLGILFFFIAFFIKWYRWYYLINYHNSNIHFYDSFVPFIIGLSVNSIIPFKIGELLKVKLTKNKSKVAIAKGLGSVAIERTFDGLSLLLLMWISIHTSYISVWIKKLFYIALILFTSILIFLYATHYSVRIIEKMLKFILKDKFNKFQELIINFINSLKLLRKRKYLFITILLSLLIWFSEAGIFYFFSQSLNLNLSYINTFLVMAILNFGIIFISSPGAIGVFEFLIIKGLSLFQISNKIAFAYAILLHCFMYIPFIIIAFLLIFKRKIDFNLSRNKNH